MQVNTIINADVLEGLKSLDDKSVDCLITSPPYWQLRDYGYHEQWGLEPTFQEYLEHLWSMMDEVWRVLKDTGTVWINLGDSYSGSNGAGCPMTKWDGLYDGVSLREKSGRKDNLPSKCLLLIPHRFAIGCIERGWILRNDIIWAKPNGMPESVTDRFSKKHEFVFFFTKQQKYFFDLDAVREELKNPVMIRNKASENYGRGSGTKQFSEGARVWGDVSKGKNPGDVSDFWAITTKPSSAKHYATFNNELITKPILAGCPEGGIVLDPFAGTGTTIATAIQLGRYAIGIEASKEYCKIAENRIDEVQGLFKQAM